MAISKIFIKLGSELFRRRSFRSGLFHRRSFRRGSFRNESFRRAHFDVSHFVAYGKNL
jgi:hypothetical protein